MCGKKIQHRGTHINPVNRFTDQYIEEDLSELLSEDLENLPKQKTIFYTDHAEKVISYNSSPDIPFEASINPYRGCEHGCAYCYARPSHEYLDLSAGIDFETKIFYKKDIGKKLENTFRQPS
jgi:tRNA A37 methylthiotransferase MiaB